MVGRASRGPTHHTGRERRMPRRWCGLAVTLVSLLGIGLASAADAAAEVRGLLDRQVACWNRKDLDGFLETYWHNPGVVFQSGGTRSDGFEAMRDRYRKRYQGAGRE